MSQLFKKALSLITGTAPQTDLFQMPKNRPLKKMTERELLRLESQIGSTLFGDIPTGRTRQFFCLDATTWIWYEEWKDEKGVQQRATTRYEVHDDKVLKVQEGARYSYIEGEELQNLMVATRLYYEKVAREVYRRDPHTGHKLA